tara:strand:- start:1271 stop:1603 length:333 start_codon:yes stop_codon:yes gene_type:complete
MNWEVANGITGLISAFCAVISLRFLITHDSYAENTPTELLPLYKLMSFLLFCSGWVLTCLCCLWFFEPFGMYVSGRDYQKFFGILLSVPSLIILSYGYNLLFDEKVKHKT